MEVGTGFIPIGFRGNAEYYISLLSIGFLVISAATWNILTVTKKNCVMTKISLAVCQALTRYYSETNFFLQLR